MATTIQISDNVKMLLERIKMFERESYNEVIERMLEDERELNETTKKEIESARKRIKSGEFITMEEVKKKLNL